MPLALAVIHASGVKPKGETAAAIETLGAWVESGAHRRDKDRDGTYDDADAVRIIDAWWPRWVTAEFKPTLGGNLFAALLDVIGFHDAPGPIGSAFHHGWYGYVSKDLRTVLGEPVKGAYSKTYCGKGRLKACAKALLKSLG